MNNVKKYRFSATVLFLVIMVTIAVFSTFNADTVYAGSTGPKATVKNVKKGTSFKAGNLKYKVTAVSSEKKTVQVTGSASKKMTKVVIPASVKITSKKGKYKGTYIYKVTSVKAKAFQKAQKIKSVRFGSNVVNIGNRAFYGCKKLQTVILSKSVEKIGSYAFAACPKLTKVTVPKKSKLKTIGDHAFYKCSKLKTMNLKNASGLKKVSGNAFKGTKIKNIDVGGKNKGDGKTVDPTAYKYEIIPLLAPFNEYFEVYP